MRIWRSLYEAEQEIIKNNVRTILTIGNFDGVHRGHQAIMKRIRELKEDLSGWGVALVFVNHTESVLGKTPFLLNSKSLQRELLSQQGLDAILEIEFDAAIAEITAVDFFFNWIETGFHAAALVVGHDFHFGADGQGDYRLLGTLSRQQRIHLEQIPPICESDMIISSSNIRKLLSRGEMEMANRMLGYSFIIEGMVTTGIQLGRKLGYPTANLQLEPGLQLPCYGVYLVRLNSEGRVYHGLANLGVKPTFDGTLPLLEVYLFDVRVDLYHKVVRVEFLHFIRPERRFSGPNSLQKQIEQDVALAKQLLESHEPSRQCVREKTAD